MKRLIIIFNILISVVAGKIQAQTYTPTLLGEEFNSPTDVAVDAAGNIYVADYGNDVVKKMNSSGGQIEEVRSFVNPYGIALDASGDIYVISQQNKSSVRKIDASTGKVQTFADGFDSLTGIIVDPAGNVYVTDIINKSIKKISASGKDITTVITGLTIPYGAALDVAGNIYVADAGKNSIKKINISDGSVKVLGDGFKYPNGVAVDAAGNIYVSDTNNGVVKKMDASGGNIITIGSGVTSPNGLAVDAAGNVYVADTTKKSIVKYILNSVLNTQSAVTAKKSTFYPNPAKDFVIVELGKAQNGRAELYDVSGKKVKEAALKGNKSQISVVDLPKGTYIIKVSSGEEKSAQKLIKN